MKVKKEKFDKSLHPFLFKATLISKIVSKKWRVSLYNAIAKINNGKNIDGLDCAEIYIPSKNGGKNIRVRIYRPKNQTKPLPAMLYNHGGGYMLGTPERGERIIKRFIDTRPCVLVVPDYRLSIKNPYPAGFNDCYDTLLWMKENADELNILSEKFIIAGHSAGGGMTAGLTLKVRETKDVNIAFQMPVYPMIDYKQSTKSATEFTSVPLWNAVTSKLAWDLYLKNVKDEIPIYASPTLNDDYTDFPPTITFVGELEPLRDETIAYVENLKKFNIPVKFKVFKGAFHSFETVAPDAEISKQANQFQFDAFAEFYDKYVIAEGDNK